MTHNLGKGKYKHRILEPGETRLNHREKTVKCQSYMLDFETIDFIHEDAARNNLNLSAYIRKLVRQAHENYEVNA